MQVPLSGCGLQHPKPLGDRTVQLYLPDRSNPGCSPCQPSATSRQPAVLPLAPVLHALPRLRAEGYEVLCLSGGEPLQYPHLHTLLAAAKAEGFRTAAVTNGCRVTARHRRLVDALEQITISFDGMGALHNRIRGNRGAWDAAIAALRFLSEIGKPAAATYTVSRASRADIPDFIELCALLSVRAVTLRPLLHAGHPRVRVTDLALAEADLAGLWNTAQTLKRTWEGVLDVHVDLAPVAALAADPATWDLALNGRNGLGLSDIINPLVVTAEGVLRPYIYDFPEEYDLGRLPDLAPDRKVWIAGGLSRLRRLLVRTLHAAALEDGPID